VASVRQDVTTSQSTPPLQSMPAINSSFIALFEYDQANLALTTHLKNGAIYQHKFVLPSEWTALQTSQNHSKHWSNAISGKKLSVRVKSAKTPNSEIRKGRKKNGQRR
jgi:KTSC domain